MKAIPEHQEGKSIAEYCTYWISIKITVIKKLESDTVFDILVNLVTKVGITNN